MKLTFRYIVSYHKDGEDFKDEFDVDFSGVESDSALDETARRILIERILRNGGIVSQIQKLKQEWK
jgi:hypothetical protein